MFLYGGILVFTPLSGRHLDYRYIVPYIDSGSPPPDHSLCIWGLDTHCYMLDTYCDSFWFAQMLSS